MSREPQGRGPQPNNSDGPRVNRDIRVSQVRLVDENGDMLGVMTTAEAIQKAVSVGLDLVEISPTASPPVCKLLDYGKYKYEEQKKKAAVRKKQKIIEIKEVKVRPMIEEHDYQVKLRNMIRFFEEGDRVKVTMRFRGREIDHQEIGLEVLRRLCTAVAEIAKIEQHPRLEGKQMFMLLSPK